MGRKRKGRGRPFGQPKSEDDFTGSSKLKLDNYEDIADSEDEFATGQDKILLEEEPIARRTRKRQEEEEFLQPSDEEVYASEPSDVVSDNGDDDDDDDGEDGSIGRSSRIVSPNDGRNQIFAEEVNEREEEEEEEEDDDDDDYAGWGNKRDDYYNADVIETEQDALEEEQEAHRLQRKQLQSMTEADYGFDQAEWLDSGGAAKEEEGGEEDEVVREVLPQLEITDDMSKEDKLKVMRVRYPEFEPLAKDFVALQPLHEELKFAAAEAEAVVDHVQSPKATKGNTIRSTCSPVAVIKYQTLSAYLAAISMYFVLFTSTTTDSQGPALSLPASELREHPVMDALVKCRKLWEQVKDLAIPDVAEVADEIERGPSPPILKNTSVNGASKSSKLTATTAKNEKKKKKSKAQRAAEAAQAKAEAQEQERRRKVEEGLADLSDLLALSAPPRQPKTPSTKRKRPDDVDSDFGEETGLTAHEAAEKAKKRKTLRFYTSQIAQKSNKRDAAGRDAGGDTDLPYRERLKDRQSRLNAEAEKRGRKPRDVDDDELGRDSDDDDRMIAKDVVRGGGTAPDEEKEEEEENYYNMVSARSKQKKAEKKKILADSYAEAAALLRGGGSSSRVEVQDVVETGPDGKRKITYAIEKNKGITPARKKNVRNPRVKKRQKFEDKKKKLASMRPVFNKGGEGPGGYGGELSGIKKNLVKSIKL